MFRSIKSVFSRLSCIVIMGFILWWIIIMPLPINKNSYIPINFSNEDREILKETYWLNNNTISTDEKYIMGYYLEGKSVYYICFGMEKERRGKATVYTGNKTVNNIINRTLDLHEKFSGDRVVKNTEYGIDENFSTSGWSIIFFDRQRDAQYLRLFTWILSTLLSSLFLMLILRRLKNNPL
jgi:hypothetical protein